MAKTAARSSRSRGRSTDAEASGSLKAASEVLGLVIVALAALCALAIATFDAGDPEQAGLFDLDELPQGDYVRMPHHRVVLRQQVFEFSRRHRLR